MPKYAELYAPISDAIRDLRMQFNTNTANEHRRAAIGLQNMQIAHGMRQDQLNQEYRERQEYRQIQKDNAQRERDAFEQRMAIKADARADSADKRAADKAERDLLVTEGEAERAKMLLRPHPVNILNWLPDDPDIREAVMENPETQNSLGMLFGPGVKLAPDGSLLKDGQPLHMNGYQVSAAMPGIFGIVEHLVDPVDRIKTNTEKLNANIAVLEEKRKALGEDPSFGPQRLNYKNQIDALKQQREVIQSIDVNDLIEMYQDKGDALNYYALKSASLGQTGMSNYFVAAKQMNDGILKMLMDNQMTAAGKAAGDKKPWTTGKDLIRTHYQKDNFTVLPQNKPTSKYANKLFAKFNSVPTITEQQAANAAIEQADAVVEKYWNRAEAQLRADRNIPDDQEVSAEELMEYVKDPSPAFQVWLNKTYTPFTEGFVPHFQTVMEYKGLI